VKSKATAQALLLADEEAWNRAGEELRLVDPHRYLALLKIAQDVCNIHRDPIGAEVADGVFIFGKESDTYD